MNDFDDVFISFLDKYSIHFQWRDSQTKSKIS